jgi:cell division protein FtsZ
VQKSAPAFDSATRGKAQTDDQYLDIPAFLRRQAN